MIVECPNVYFSGNCKQFAHKMITGIQGQRVSLVCVPAFAETGQIVLLDLDTLVPKLIQFDLVC